MIKIIKIIISFFDYFTEKKIFEIIQKLLGNEINLLIDVGAHKGLYFLELQKKIKINRIIGFEPNPVIYKILEKNISKYSDKIKIYKLATGTEKKNTILNINLESSSSTINNLNYNSKYFKRKFRILNFFGNQKIITPTKINIIKLDDFINENKIQLIDLLKIDTEGFEYNTLLGISKNINRIKAIHFEHHFDDMIIKDYKFSDIHNFLVENSFIKFFKIKMKFRKSFEYIYINEKLLKYTK
jgi:FkbM family methyltransferase